MSWYLYSFISILVYAVVTVFQLPSASMPCGILAGFHVHEHAHALCGESFAGSCVIDAERTFQQVRPHHADE